MKLSRTILGEEAKRRIENNGADASSKPNSHATLAVLTSYLKNNPVTQVVELQYLANAMETLVNNIKHLAETSNTGMKSNTAQWRNFLPCDYLRFYHVLIELRDKFLMRDSLNPC